MYCKNKKTTAIINEEFVLELNDFVIDSTATIELTNYQANALSYESNTSLNQFAVFSDMYYKDGWNAYVDGEETKIYRVDYVLRAIEVPAGKHTIEFKFEPSVIKTGSRISLISYALLLLIPIGWFFMDKKKKQDES